MNSDKEARYLRSIKETEPVMIFVPKILGYNPKVTRSDRRKKNKKARVKNKKL